MKLNYRINTAIILTAAIVLLTACASHKRGAILSPEAAFHKAMEKFDRGKYLDAMEELTVIILNYSGSSIIDSAQYYLGESHYRMKEYIIAASEFQRLVDQYPSSPIVDNAKYKIGMCYYKLSPSYGLDQEYTAKCIEEFQEFTEYFPASELVPEVMEKMFQARSKIAMKTYKSGELYFKMKDYDSAIIYFDIVLENYYDTIYAPRSLLLTGESYLRMKKIEDAQIALEKLLDKYPDSPEAQEAKTHLNPEKVEIE